MTERAEQLEGSQRTDSFFTGLGEDLFGICRGLGLEPEAIRKLGSALAGAVQSRMDEYATELPGTEMSGVVLGHVRDEMIPELAFFAAVNDKVDEIDPPTTDIQGELLVTDEHTRYCQGAVVPVPQGFYSDLTPDGLLIYGGDGRTYESHAELAEAIGIWPEE